MYQLATALSVEHGDTSQFPNGWNNPSHDQLPGLVKNNGLLPVADRIVIARLLRQLRTRREDADYRPGYTVNRVVAQTALFESEAVFDRIRLED